MTDRDLYARGLATALASWEHIARGSRGAVLHRIPGVAAAVFPHGPERAVYNNAVLGRDLPARARASAIAAMEAAYGEAGVERYAAWVHESDGGIRRELAARGYTVDESTRAMGMNLDDASPAAGACLEDAEWEDHLEHLQSVGLPAGLLDGVDPAAFHVLAGRLDGESVATGIAFDHDGDCGVFNVSTIATARRRGLGTALTIRLVRDARARGCTTASLQSTPIAEGVYAAAGFRDLGRILEYVPGSVAREVDARIVIRTARSADGDALAVLHRRASYVWDEDRDQLDAHPEVFGVAPDLLEAGHVRVAALPDGTVVGFASVRPRPHGTCEVEDLFVEPDVMRNGIGRALIEDAAARAATAGCKVMSVVGAERTRGFYERVGFVVQGRATTRFGPALRLCRTLAS